jgi:hypothetical protein
MQELTKLCLIKEVERWMVSAKNLIVADELKTWLSQFDQNILFIANYVGVGDSKKTFVGSLKKINFI